MHRCQEPSSFTGHEFIFVRSYFFFSEILNYYCCFYEGVMYDQVLKRTQNYCKNSKVTTSLTRRLGYNNYMRTKLEQQLNRTEAQSVTLVSCGPLVTRLTGFRFILSHTTFN